MRRIVYFLFPLALLGVLAYVVTTSASLPERVASHFGANGVANGYMSRDGYRTFILCVRPRRAARRRGDRRAAAARVSRGHQHSATATTGSHLNAARTRWAT